MIPLAPLHNPANITGIEEAMAYAAGVLQVAVFDTAFHQTMPAYAYQYAVPHQWYTERCAVTAFMAPPIFMSQNKPLIILSSPLKV